ENASNFDDLIEPGITNTLIDKLASDLQALRRDTKYEGYLFYEEKADLNEYVATFTVTKDEDTLDDYAERKHPGAVICLPITFRFVQQDSSLTSRGDYIELQFDTPQDEPTTGWIIKPHTVPCRIYRSDVDKVGTPGYPDPPSCSISVHATPDAVLRLHYTIPVEGMVKRYTLDIRRTLRRGPLLDINDLQYLLDTLNETRFSQTEWNRLGDALGLYGSTLKAIEAEYPGDEQGCLQCLVKWLERADCVDDKGGPTMFSLSDALEDIGEKAAAKYIIEQVNCIEVHCQEESIECSVRKDVKEAITSAAEKHNLSESHKNPEIRFYCSCGRGLAGGGVAKGEKHTVTVNEEQSIFECTKTEEMFRCDEKIPWKSWLCTDTPNTPTSNDESTSPATKQGTPQRSVSETGSTGSPQEAKDPKEILQKYSAKLTKAISANVDDVAKALFAKDLITQGTREYVVTAVGVPTADKADRVMTDVMGQAEASLDERQYLTDVCNILIQQGAAMKQIGNVMLTELGEDTATVHPPLPQCGASFASEGTPQRNVSETGSTGSPQEAKGLKELTTAQTNVSDVEDHASPQETKGMPELNSGAFLKIFSTSADQYMLIGAGLNVDVTDLMQMPGQAMNNLIMVFQKWSKANKSFTWDALIQLCDTFPDQLGKAKAILKEELGI
uniref:Death domain-containing protein n=1 Tax=Amphimedon queenslandica TaxID=400682 RepID=A0A1X7TKU9_AMPQE